MSERRRGLGRGLGALIPSAPAADPADAGSDEAPESQVDVRETDAVPTSATPPESMTSGRASADRTTADGIDVSRETSTTENQDATSSRPRPVSDAASSGTGDTQDLGAQGTSNRPTTGHRTKSVSPAARQKAMKARMDMGEALRNTTLVSRPSDMFFLPSTAASGDGASAPAPDAPAGDDATETALAPSGTPDVSRETSEASTQSTPSPITDLRGTQDESAAPMHLSDDEKRSAPESHEPVEADVSRETADAAEQLATVPGATFAEIPVASIHPNRKQPRQEFDDEELAELAYSIAELGVLQPIVVRPSRENGETAFELVMGERRWRATQRAGLTAIPAIVRETADDDLLRDALLENLHRSQLNPLEEAAAYQQLLEEFGTTQEELSRRIGRSRPQISNTIRLLRLPPLVQRRVAAGVLSSGHARALLSLTDPAEMERLAQRIVAEGLSVRATEEAVAMSEPADRKAKRVAAPSGRHKERLDYIAEAFSDRLDTSVQIALGARKGKMTIEFASVEDLNRIIEVLDPGLDRH